MTLEMDHDVQGATAMATVPIEPPARRGRRRVSPIVVLAAIWLVALAFVAIAAPLLHLPDYARIGSELRVRPSLDRLFSEPLGTDHLGRSEFSRVIYGARASIIVGVGGAVIGMVIGTLLGLVAAYFRGPVDRTVATALDVILAFPALVLLLALVSTLQPSVRTLVLALSVVVTPVFARIARANAMTVGRRDFVRAAEVLGASRTRIMFREILPNIISPVLSYAFVVIATLIIAEGSLSFLGLGVPPPQPSWGGMIAEGKDRLATDPHLVFVPAAFLFLTVFSLNIVGDHLLKRLGLREARI